MLWGWIAFDVLYILFFSSVTSFQPVHTAVCGDFFYIKLKKKLCFPSKMFSWLLILFFRLNNCVLLYFNFALSSLYPYFVSFFPRRWRIICCNVIKWAFAVENWVMWLLSPSFYFILQLHLLSLLLSVWASLFEPAVLPIVVFAIWLGNNQKMRYRSCRKIIIIIQLPRVWCLFCMFCSTCFTVVVLCYFYVAEYFLWWPYHCFHTVLLGRISEQLVA